MPELVTKRLRLIPLTLSALRLRLSDYQRMEFSLGLRLAPAPFYVDESYDEGARQAITSAIALITEDESSYLWHTFWQIVLKSQNRIIGEFDFHGSPDVNGIVTFGCMIRPEFRNQGYATEAVRKITAWALKQPSVSTLATWTDKQNVASQKVLVKLGAQIYEEDETTYRWKMPS